MKLDEILSQHPGCAELRSYATAMHHAALDRVTVPARLNDATVRVALKNEDTFITSTNTAEPVAMHTEAESSGFNDRANQCAYIRAQILLHVATLHDHLKHFKSFEEPTNMTLKQASSDMFFICEELVASQVRLMQTYLDLLDAAEAIVVDSGETRAQANSWVSFVDRAISDARLNAHLGVQLFLARRQLNQLPN